MNNNLLNGKKYRDLKMDAAEKDRILQAIRSGQSPRSSTNRNLFPKLLSAFAVLLFVSVLGLYSYDYLFESNPLRFGGQADPYQKVSIQPSPGIEIVEQEDGALRFMRGNEYVGGLTATTMEELKSPDAELPLYWAIEIDKEVKGLSYPTERRLFHVKNMDAIQVNHFYVTPDATKDLVYDVYFHTPAIELTEAMEMMKTLRISP